MHLSGSAPGRDLGHLSYCTNIHAGESLDEVMRSLALHLPAIKAQVAGKQDFGVGLRLGFAAANSLREPGALDRLKQLLADGGYYVFTINGFPYGAFHGRAVKEDVYKPDWSDPQRLAYTNRLADIMSALMGAAGSGSISTVPCTFKPWLGNRLEAIVDNLIRHVSHLVGISNRTGQTISLALEPEPYCYLETIDETVAFFNAHLFGATGIARLAALTGLSAAQAALAMRKHLGVCYDVCHAAVEFEDAKTSIASLRAEGIPIAKAQLSSALRVAAVDADSRRHLTAFVEPTYLHQVVQRSNGSLQRYVDLPQALSDPAAVDGSEWRVHFHVPVFLERMAHFDTTQGFLKEVLALHRADPFTMHLEVETYTWDVLPDAYRNVDLSTAIAREINWVKAELGR